MAGTAGNEAAFGRMRAEFAAKHAGRWVAVLGDEVLVSGSLRDLEELLDGRPGGDFACVERIP